MLPNFKSLVPGSLRPTAWLQPRALNVVPLVFAFISSALLIVLVLMILAAGLIWR